MTSVWSASARALRAAVFCSLALGLMACEEDVTDGLATERPFTVYGFVDPTADTQYVRVFPISPTNLSRAVPEPLDAEVIFRDLATGVTVSGRDSVVQFFSGRYGHVYWAPFSPAYSGLYGVEIRRSDGATSEAVTRVPGELAYARGQPFTTFRLEDQGFVPFLPMDLTGQDMRLLRVTARYEVELLNVGRQIIEIPYLQKATSTADGWAVAVDLKSDFNTIFEALRDLRERFGQELVDFIRLDFIPEVANADWVPPGGVFDSDLLVEPGAFDNVENGFGFFGSAYQQVHRVPVEPCLRLIVGFAESPLACSPTERCEYLEQCSE